MPELSPDLPSVPVKPIGNFVRGPTVSEMSTWERLVQQAHRAGIALDICALIFQNAVVAHQFAQKNGIDIEIIPPELEQRYLAIRSKFDRLRRAIRGVENHTLGVQFRDGDIDIVAESAESAENQGFSGLPLIILGVVVVAAAAAVAIWATRNAIEVIHQARALVQRADDRFCADPQSAICEEWKAEKEVTGFNKRDTIADTIKSVGQAGKSIAIGVLLLLGAGLLLRRK
jgi:hypothetical protein